MKLSSSFIFFFTCMTESTFRFCITGAASVGRPVSLKEKHFTKIYCWDTNKVAILKACGHQLEAQTTANFNKTYISEKKYASLSSKKFSIFTAYIGTAFYFVCAMWGRRSSVFWLPFEICFSWLSLTTPPFSFGRRRLQFVFIDIFF